MTEVPANILQMHPDVPPDSWVRVSENRWQAQYQTGAVRCVVDAFGEWLSQGCRPEDVDETFANLFVHVAQLAAHRTACVNGSPVVRPDDEENSGVVGQCWWCGLYPHQHVPDEPEQAIAYRKRSEGSG